jgi:beta-galactosidase
MGSRRQFLLQSATLAAGAASISSAALAVGNAVLPHAETTSLCGTWFFRIDAEDSGTKQEWFRTANGDWHNVNVPHTWQVEPAWADYHGPAWYRRTFDCPQDWAGAAVRIEFEAVFHSATVWVNGQLAGEHLRKGYTAFALDISRLLRLGQPNAVVVRVDNSFDEHMLPRGRSSDWAHDGGIFRPVQLIVTPKTFAERVDVEAFPDLATGDGKLAITAHCRNAGFRLWTGHASFRIVDDQTGLEILADSHAGSLSIRAGTTQTLTLQATLPKARLWHFDQPNLYRLEFTISNERGAHQFTTTFGVRRLEIKDGAFHLNGERVRLMGVERMAGSNPAFGMAEPGEWIMHDHDDLKHLNCIFTRVHWPQDRRVLDYCDRHGILMQSEIPTWGMGTFKGMGAEPDADILENGLAQLREMMERDRNHPSIVVWGLCNEIGGQDPPAYQFARHMLEEAKKQDPNRLCSYASHSLRETPERDVAGLMDFIETNEYFGSWQKGNAESVAQHLDHLHAVFPGKPVVISEYGYCACTADRPEGDAHRVEILRSHDSAVRSREFVGGAIFFCYNDYRTHVGDRGVKALKQRVHGVVDLYGRQKPSYANLREESSPLESLEIENQLNTFRLRLKTRSSLPMYTLRAYRLRGIFYGQGDIPVEQQEMDLPEVAPGGQIDVELTFDQSGAPLHVQFDVLRSTHFSAFSSDWKP